MLRLGFVLALGALLAGCDIGNSSGTCSTGDTCTCDGIGNCEYSCPGGDCTFRCKGTGNCIYTCEGGGCDLTCENTGNCIMDCPGDDCSITCKGTGNCILNKCTAGCGDGGGPDQRVTDGKPPAGDGQVDDAKPPVGDGCEPSTCVQLGKNCGPNDNGCGTTLQCGTCSVGTCGGGGTTGVCGCPTTTDTAPASPTAASDVSSVGTVPWDGPGEVLTPDASSGTPPSGVASVQLSTGNSPSHYLVASGFGFNIPAGSIINGIEVDIRRRCRENGSNLIDNDVRLVQGNKPVTGNRAGKYSWSNSWIYASYGGQTDLWGRLWSPAEINSPSFGVALSVAWKGTSGNDDAYVDHVRVMVHYAQCGCVPDTCSGKGYDCGSHADGCGGTINCGSCSSGTCINGKCCVPQTCSGLGYDCGSHADGCGGTVNCGSCSSGTCINGKCCVPDTCAGLGYACGTQSDGCGGTIDCGSCSSGTCVNGQCCVPQTCTSLGYACGSHSDGCGGTVNCGSCSSGTCVNGQCCVPDTCAGLGYACGSYSDGCGGTIDCGGCAPGDTCTLGTCGCADGAKGASEADVDCGGVCPQKCGQGKTCGSGTDCVSASCVDGVCCDTTCTGLCMACNAAKTGGTDGTCGPVATGTDPDKECTAQTADTCGTTGFCANGDCELYPAGTECAPSSCTGTSEVAADTCDGAGTCVDNGTVTCTAPYVCGATACESCTDGVKNGNETDVDCGGGGACSGCADGKICTTGTDCTSGNCVDGVCCNTTCTGLCMACNITGSVGTCSNIEGSDPIDECPGPKVCSGGACTN